METVRRQQNWIIVRGLPSLRQKWDGALNHLSLCSKSTRKKALASYPYQRSWLPLTFNPLNAELNPTCHLVALLGAHPILHISRIKVNYAAVLAGLVSGFILTVTRGGGLNQRECFSQSLYSSVSCNKKKFLQNNLIPNYFNIAVSKKLCQSLNANFCRPEQWIKVRKKIYR
jgi:hypothetical protein